MSTKHTRGPWTVLPEEVDCYYIRVRGTRLGERYKVANVPMVTGRGVPAREADETRANARLIAAAPEQHAEMLRYLPVLERAEADPELWERLTAGLGIATLNGYRAAIAKATGGAS